MYRVLRSILAILAGMILGSLVVALVEFIAGLFYPYPAGLDPYNPADRKQLEDHLAAAPAIVFVFLLLAYVLGPAMGAWIAAALAGRAPVVHALIVGVLFLVASAVNLSTIAHPAWFVAANLLVVLPAAYVGGRLARTTSEGSTIR